MLVSNNMSNSLKFKSKEHIFFTFYHLIHTSIFTIIYIFQLVWVTLSLSQYVNRTGGNPINDDTYTDIYSDIYNSKHPER
jgi:hypothetical protein